LDGAHTPESMKACKNWFFDKATTTTASLKALVFNCNTNREPTTLLREIAHCHFDFVLFTTNDTGKIHLLEDKRPTKHNSPTPLDWQQKNMDIWLSLSDSSSENCKIVDSIPSVFEQLYTFEKTHPSQKVDVLITGSLYLVGACLELLKPDMCDVF